MFFNYHIDFFKSAVLSTALLALGSCTNRTPNEDGKPEHHEIQSWVTKADQTAKLQKQENIVFNNSLDNLPAIVIDESKTFQTVDGFGYTLTGGSVQVINTLPEVQKQNLLQELFGNGESSIGISYLRLSMGASDLDSKVFSYNDLPEGETDLSLSKFSLEKDKDLIAMIKKILAINPEIKFMAVPWSPPVWMKDNGSSIGGSLKPEYYSVYADYFVKYIQGMAAQGIKIDAITPQNEPLHPGNNPSMLMLPEQQKEFIKNHLGPAFESQNIKTKIVLYDHNCDKPEYPISILNDPAAKKYIDGSAFHLYAGDISALSTVYNAHPDKNLYFTEQWTGTDGEFHGDLMWHLKNVVIGSMKNHSKTALEWNLANDENYQPHTPGGCTECKGALTIKNGSVERNVGYYIIAQASKFIPSGSKKIESTDIAGLSSAAFRTPHGKTVLIVLNDTTSKQNFNIKFKNKTAVASLDSHSAATYVF